LEVARSVFPSFQGDVWFVELDSFADPGLVPSAIAEVLGLRSGGEKILSETIAHAIGGKKLLLILDSCEHLLGAVARLVETVVRLCRHTTVLATSREVLRVDGEYAYRVPPLEVPPPDHQRSDGILDYTAVQLFIVRTSARTLGGLPGAADLSTIAAICRRLDGIPLAIEFAAARATSLGLQRVAALLDDRFALLREGRRTAPPRHQTLRATMDWSYELLPEPERNLLCHLAIFTDGFSLEAAAAVLGDSRNDASALVEWIASLVAKSFITLDWSASGDRWQMLETIRAYALEKLTERGEAEAAARRHAEFLRDLVAPTGPQLQPPIEKHDPLQPRDRQPASGARLVLFGHWRLGNRHRPYRSICTRLDRSRDGDRVP
jgi:predicted ATPase